MSNEFMLIVGILGCTFLLMNAIFGGILFFTRRKMAAVQGWSSTMGTVLASYLERRRSGNRGSANYPVVQYNDWIRVCVLIHSTERPRRFSSNR